MCIRDRQNQGGGFANGGGGGFGNGGGGFGNGGGFGGGLQSIPPDKTISMKYVSVCLEHGKPDPTPRGSFVIQKVDDYTDNPVLKELISMVGSGQMAPKAAQAAVWNVTDKMSWQQLASKGVRDHMGNFHSFFRQQDIAGAQLIQRTAVARINERKDGKEGSEKKPRQQPRQPARIR